MARAGRQEADARRGGSATWRRRCRRRHRGGWWWTFAAASVGTDRRSPQRRRRQGLCARHDRAGDCGGEPLERHRRGGGCVCVDAAGPPGAGPACVFNRRPARTTTVGGGSGNAVETVETVETSKRSKRSNEGGAGHGRRRLGHGRQVERQVRRFRSRVVPEDVRRASGFHERRRVGATAEARRRRLGAGELFAGARLRESRRGGVEGAALLVIRGGYEASAVWRVRSRREQDASQGRPGRVRPTGGEATRKRLPRRSVGAAGSVAVRRERSIGSEGRSRTRCGSTRRTRYASCTSGRLEAPSRF